MKKEAILILLLISLLYLPNNVEANNENTDISVADVEHLTAEAIKGMGPFLDIMDKGNKKSLTISFLNCTEVHISSEPVETYLAKELEKTGRFCVVRDSENPQYVVEAKILGQKETGKSLVRYQYLYVLDLVEVSSGRIVFKKTVPLTKSKFTGDIAGQAKPPGDADIDQASISLALDMNDYRYIISDIFKKMNSFLNDIKQRKQNASVIVNSLQNQNSMHITDFYRELIEEKFLETNYFYVLLPSDRGKRLLKDRKITRQSEENPCIFFVYAEVIGMERTMDKVSTVYYRFSVKMIDISTKRICFVSTSQIGKRMANTE